MRPWWTNLGTNVTPALTRDVEAAIAAHLNVSTLSTADSFLRKQSPPFVMSTLNFTVWNPAFARPASLLLNLRAGSSGLVQRRPGAAATSVLWVESGGGGGGGGRVRREISDAEDPRPVRLNGALYVVFVRYLARRHKRVVLARLEEPCTASLGSPRPPRCLRKPSGTVPLGALQGGAPPLREQHRLGRQLAAL